MQMTCSEIQAPAAMSLMDDPANFFQAVPEAYAKADDPEVPEREIPGSRELQKDEGDHFMPSNLDTAPVELLQAMRQAASYQEDACTPPRGSSGFQPIQCPRCKEDHRRCELLDKRDRGRRPFQQDQCSRRYKGKPPEQPSSEPRVTTVPELRMLPTSHRHFTITA